MRAEDLRVGQFIYGFNQYEVFKFQVERIDGKEVSVIGVKGYPDKKARITEFTYDGEIYWDSPDTDCYYWGVSPFAVIRDYFISIAEGAQGPVDKDFPELQELQKLIDGIKDIK